MTIDTKVDKLLNAESDIKVGNYIVEVDIFEGEVDGIVISYKGEHFLTVNYNYHHDFKVSDIGNTQDLEFMLIVRTIVEVLESNGYINQGGI